MTMINPGDMVMMEPREDTATAPGATTRCSFYVELGLSQCRYMATTGSYGFGAGTKVYMTRDMN